MRLFAEQADIRIIDRFIMFLNKWFICMRSTGRPRQRGNVRAEMEKRGAVRPGKDENKKACRRGQAFFVLKPVNE